jgi:Ca-activated chloride channel homolog
MKFGNIEYLTLLWILPGMILLAVYAFRKKDQLLRLFADTDLWERLMPEASRRRQVIKFLLLLAGVSLLLTALLSPRWGFQWQEVQRRGVDILVAVDVSKSMLAEDVKPNRLERAKREITDLVGMLQGDRIGLIAFAGASFLECPLTLDHGAFSMFLDYLDTDLIPVPGTDVGGAIQTAIDSFVPGRHASKALILITDGEDHPGQVQKKAEEAKKKGIRIFTVGIGSQEGAPIPLANGSGGFKKDRSGELILSRLDDASLQKIALETGGNYVRSVSGDMDLKKIYEEIRSKMEAGELQSSKRKRWEERFQWFLLASLFLFCLEALLSERKRAPGTWNGGWRLPFLKRLPTLVLFLPAWLLLATCPAAAESVYGKIRQGEKAYGEERYDEALKEFLDAQVEDPENTLLKYNIGEAQYRMRNFAEAEAAFRDVAASGDPLLEQRSLYNLGNCAYRQGKLEEAVANFQQALDRNPEDEDARFNLEFVREEIKRRINENQERQKQQEQEQKQGQSCPNPQPQAGGSEGSGEKKQQEPQQQQGKSGQPSQSQPDQQQGSGEQAQPPPSPEPGEQKRPQDSTAESQAAGAGEQTPAAEGSGPGEQKTAESLSGNAGTPQAGERMSQEEADRWMNSLDEEQKDLAQRQIQKALGQGGRGIDKDW